MGARLTRFDVDALALEARLTPWRRELIVRVRGVAGEDGATRLHVECGGADPAAGFDFGWTRLTIVRFRVTLATTDPPPPPGP
jgi:hypothetical protein